jgi:hypothetical protein
VRGNHDTNQRPVIDAAIPELSRLTHIPEAARLLEPVLMAWRENPLPGGGGSVKLCSVTVLRGHPGSRWTLRYTIARGGHEDTLIAKVYARNRSDVAATLSTLRSKGLGRGQLAQVPSPIAYVPTLRLLLLEDVCGEACRAALQRGRGGIGERAAGWLATFHAAATPIVAAYRARDPMVAAQRWAHSVSVDAPDLKRKARHLLAALTQAQPTPPAPLYLVHGDFGGSHVYLAGETTTVIDWDSCSVGDCAEDAGRFMASLHYLAVRKPERRKAITEAAVTFAEKFQASVPIARRSLAFYEASGCLRKAARLAAHGRSRHLRYASEMLHAGEQALPPAQAGCRAASRVQQRTEEI